MPASARQPPRPRQFAERTGPRPCCRGGFYIRPEPGTVYPGPRWLRELDTDAPCAPLRWVRLTDCLGCRYRAGRCGHRPLRSAVGGGAARAAIKAAPTPHFRPGSVGAGGGHKGRPYAALSAWSVGRGAHTPHRTPGITGHASEIAGLPGRIYNPPLRTRSRPRRRGGLYARPKPGPDSRRGTMVPPARTAGQSKISPGAERKLSFRTVPGLSAFIGMLAGYFINLSMAEQRSSRACSSPSSTASTIQCRI